MVKRIGIVVPTYKEELWSKFIRKWDGFASTTYDITVYVVIDQPKRWEGFDNFKQSKDRTFKCYSWKEIDKDLGEDAWIISRRSSAIRSYGYLKAYQDGMDYILTLDDDCYPTKEVPTIEELISYHLLGLTRKNEYSNTFNVGDFLFPDEGLWMRGSPIRYRKPRSAVVSIGGWSNNPDLDAWTQLENQQPKLQVNSGLANVPKYSGITMCGMNIMFSRETIPIAYFLLQGERWGVDRVDDIWAGLFMKKVLDHFDLPMCINGYASIYHDRASDAMTSLKKEGISLQETELLWDRLITLSLQGDTLVDSYKDMVGKLNPDWFDCVPGFGDNLLSAMKKWVSLFE